MTEEEWLAQVPQTTREEIVEDGSGPSNGSGAVDAVNHPPHYTQHPSGIECIQITEHMNFCLGNAVKYIWRADLKSGIEDLEKARWYVTREIERRRQQNSSIEHQK